LLAAEAAAALAAAALAVVVVVVVHCSRIPLDNLFCYYLNLYYTHLVINIGCFIRL